MLRAAINYVLESYNYCNYYPEINGTDVMHFLKLEKLDFSEDAIFKIFDIYIYPEYNQINDLFYNFMIDNHNYEIENEIFFAHLSKLINYSNDNKIPLIRFPAFKRSSKNYLVSECKTDSRDPQKRFIKFVDLINPKIQNENYNETNYFLNQLAHEIGHATDDLLDFGKYKNDNKYRYSREVSAWDIAENILKTLKINNTEFEKQKKYSLDRYYKYYIVNNSL